jgi:hypothetical protein
MAGIVADESQSKTVYRTLVKQDLILPTPGAATAGAKMTVDTAKVTKNFANQFATISVHAQRKLIGMLFFWEEECTRWKLLGDEEAEILKALETNEGNKDLATALEAVEMKKKLLPSQRGEATANVSQGKRHNLPSYS